MHLLYCIGDSCGINCFQTSVEWNTDIVQSVQCRPNPFPAGHIGFVNRFASFVRCHFFSGLIAVFSYACQSVYLFGGGAVSMFFFISGYGLMASLHKKGKIYLDSFYKKGFETVTAFTHCDLYFYLYKDVFWTSVCMEYLLRNDFRQPSFAQFMVYVCTFHFIHLFHAVFPYAECKVEKRWIGCGLALLPISLAFYCWAGVIGGIRPSCPLILV